MFDQGYWPQSAEVFVYLARPRVGMCAHSGYTPRHFSLSLMYPCLLCNTFQGLSFFQVWFPATQLSSSLGLAVALRLPNGLTYQRVLASALLGCFQVRPCS